MKTNNILTKSDSYKLNHWNQYDPLTEYVYAYFEARKGAKYGNTVFFGLQYILKQYLVGVVVTQEKIDRAAALSKAHFGNDSFFNRAMWEHILHKHGGKLPVRIKAVPEGTPVTVNNIMMSVENTDPLCFSLTNFLESILTHVWYSSTVATLSREVKKMYKHWLSGTADSDAGIMFMLHDFGYRGVSSDESAAIGGAAHLINFLGTDTVPAMEMIVDYYHGNKDFTGIAYSVAATEHSIMTSKGQEGEYEIVDRLFEVYKRGILSCVADSYNYETFVVKMGTEYKNRILERDGVFVIRPDSVTPNNPTPEDLCVWTLNSLWETFGGTINTKGFKVINPKVRVLWGDGIEKDGVAKILNGAFQAGFSVENFACFGMGGGLLQKVNRDTQRFAFKSSAQCRNGVWYDVYKKPLDESKASKKGKLKLIINEAGEYETVKQDEKPEYQDQLVTVFENGELIQDYTFEEIRANARV
jgi:nicotinamide phosphoribosyltransferase